MTHGCTPNRRVITASHVLPSASRVPSVGSKMTRLQYREGHDDDSLRNAPNGRGWVASYAAAGGAEGGSDEFLESDTSTGQQDVVDDYLKFLDKRYNNLHNSEKKREPTLSVWKWLTNGADTEESSEWNVPRVDAHEDSLYVLGVANLASRKLLQKHQTTSKHLRDVINKTVVEENQKVTPIPELVNYNEVSSTKIFSSTKSLSPLLARVTVFRRMLLQYQTFKMREMIAKIALGIRFGVPRVAKLLFELGGGKRMVALTLTGVAGLMLLVIRPTVEAIVSEGAVMSKQIG